MKRRLSLSFVILLSNPFGVHAEEPRVYRAEAKEIASQTALVPATSPVTGRADHLKARVAETLPVAPGLYSAAPYSMLVYVPPPMDAKMIVNPGKSPSPRARIIEPELRLIPRR